LSELDEKTLFNMGAAELDKQVDDNMDSLDHLVPIRMEALRRYRKNPQEWSRKLAEKADQRVRKLLRDGQPEPSKPARKASWKWLIAGSIGLIGAVFYGVAHGVGQDLWLYIRVAIGLQ
jgi:hypothetical protein